MGSTATYYRGIAPALLTATRRRLLPPSWLSFVRRFLSFTLSALLFHSAAAVTIDLSSRTSPITIACSEINAGAVIEAIPVGATVLIDQCVVNAAAEPLSFRGLPAGSTVTIRNTSFTYRTSIGGAFGAIQLAGAGSTVGDGASLTIEGPGTKILGARDSALSLCAGLFIDDAVAIGSNVRLTVQDGANVTGTCVAEAAGLLIADRGRGIGSNFAITVARGASFNGYTAHRTGAATGATGFLFGEVSVATGFRLTVDGGYLRGVAGVNDGAGLCFAGGTFDVEAMVDIKNAAEVTGYGASFSSQNTFGIRVGSDFGAQFKIQIESSKVSAISAGGSTLKSNALSFEKTLGTGFALSIIGASSVVAESGRVVNCIDMSSANLVLFESTISIAGAMLTAKATATSQARVINLNRKAPTSIVISGSSVLTATATTTDAIVLSGAVAFSSGRAFDVSIDNANLTATAPGGSARGVYFASGTSNTLTTLTLKRVAVTVDGGTGAAACVAYAAISLTCAIHLLWSTLTFAAAQHGAGGPHSGGLVFYSNARISNFALTLRGTAINAVGSSPGFALGYDTLLGTSLQTIAGGRFSVPTTTVFGIRGGGLATICVKDTTNKGTGIILPAFATASDTCWPYNVTVELDGARRWAPACSAFTGIGADLLSVPAGATVLIASCTIRTSTIGVRVDALPAGAALVVRQSDITITYGSVAAAAVEIVSSGAIGAGARLELDNVVASVTRAASPSAVWLRGGHVIGPGASLIMRSCTFTATASGSNQQAMGINIGRGAVADDSFRFLIEDSDVHATSTTIGSPMALYVAKSTFGRDAVFNVLRSTIRATATSAGASAVAVAFGGTRLSRNTTMSFENSTCRATAHASATGLSLSFKTAVLDSIRELTLSFSQHSTVVALSTAGKQSRGILFLADKEFVGAVFSITDAAISTVSGSSDKAIALYLQGTIEGVAVAIRRSELSYRGSSGSACIVGDGAAVWTDVPLSITDGSTLTASTPSSGTVMAWPGTLSGTSPQTFDRITMAYESPAVRFRYPTLGGGPGVTLCLKHVTPNEPLNGTGADFFRSGCQTGTPTATNVSRSATVAVSATRSVSASALPTTSVSLPFSLSHSVRLTATATVAVSLSRTQSATFTEHRTVSATTTPTLLTTPTASVSLSPSTVPSHTETLQPTVTATQTVTSTWTLTTSVTRTNASTETKSRLLTPTLPSTLTVFVPTPAPTKPEAVPQAVRDADTAVVAVAGAMSVVSPVTAGVAIRLVSTARASNCEQPSKDEPLQQWPRLARPLGLDYGLHETSVGIARPDVELLIANATLLIALVAVAVLLGIVTSMCGHQRLPGANVREAALHNSDAQWEEAADAALLEDEKGSLLRNEGVDAAHGDIEAGLLDVSEGGAHGRTSGAAARSAAQASVYKRHRVHLLAAAATCEMVAPVLVFVIQLFLVPCVAAAVVCVDLYRFDLIPRTAAVIGGTALVVCTVMYVGLTCLCLYGWFRVVSHAPAQSLPDDTEDADGRPPVEPTHERVQTWGDGSLHPPPAASAQYLPVHTEGDGIEMVPLMDKRRSSSVSDSERSRAGRADAVNAGSVRGCNGGAATKAGAKPKGSLVQRAANAVAQYGLDNGPDWEPRTLTIPSVIVFHLWRHLAGDGRAPLEDLRNSLKDAPPAVPAALHLPVLAGVTSRNTSIFSYIRSPMLSSADAAPSSLSLSDLDTATHPQIASGESPPTTDATGLKSLLPWRVVASHGAWWLGLAELSMSFWTGIAAGLARSGYCAGAPWAALILQALFTLLLLIAWPIRAPLLAILQISVQGLQLLSLSLDMAVALHKDGDSFENVSETLAAFSDWSAVVVSTALLFAGVAAVAVRCIRSVRPSMLATKAAKWRARLADRAFGVKATFDPEAALPDEEDASPPGGPVSPLQFAVQSNTASEFSLPPELRDGSADYHCDVADPLGTPTHNSMAQPPPAGNNSTLTIDRPLGVGLGPAHVSADEETACTFDATQTEDCPQVLAESVVQTVENEPAIVASGDDHQEPGHGNEENEAAIPSVPIDVAALLDGPDGAVLDDSEHESSPAWVPPLPQAEDQLQTVGRSQLTAEQVRSDPFLRFTAFAAEGGRPLLN